MRQQERDKMPLSREVPWLSLIIECFRQQGWISMNDDAFGASSKARCNYCNDVVFGILLLPNANLFVACKVYVSSKNNRDAHGSKVVVPISLGPLAKTGRWSTWAFAMPHKVPISSGLWLNLHCLHRGCSIMMLTGYGMFKLHLSNSENDHSQPLFTS